MSGETALPPLPIRAPVTAIVPCAAGRYPAEPPLRRALELYEAGESLRRIERATGVGRMRIAKLALAFGRPARAARIAEQREALHDTIVAAFIAGTAVADIAARERLSQNMVYLYLARPHAQLRKCEYCTLSTPAAEVACRRCFRAANDERLGTLDRDEVVALRRTGATVADIAARAHATQGATRRYLRAVGFTQKAKRQEHRAKVRAWRDARAQANQLRRSLGAAGSTALTYLTGPCPLPIALDDARLSDEERSILALFARGLVIRAIARRRHVSRERVARILRTHGLSRAALIEGRRRQLREEILRLHQDGESTLAIATRLGIHPNGIRNHLAAAVDAARASA